ncbi:hypothetical protein BSL78_11079 [Apostichopus japonicus]|uniref:Reverse transcriptase n=1 Tax=Stichopus japonicus TaxID=307972 RepID=A0A2G8KVG7_STIJA|nr:hypothetical protein BSL78_11079 [Apostichopus japonicus]
MDCRLPSQLYHRGHATVIETALGRDADVDPALRDAVSDAVSDTQVRTVDEAVQRINEAQDQSLNNLREQGNWNQLFHLQDADTKWQATIRGMSEQCFSFAIRSLNNQLPVASVLCKVWNCSVSAQCGACLASRELCNAPEQTLHHVLSSCQVSLSLKHRYTWRHDNILFALRDLYTLTLGPAWDIAIDATRDGNTIVYDQHTSTIPPDILPTTCRPDLTAIDRVQRKIHIMELTCPWDSAESFNNAQERKSDRYGH